jgi:hypothetical protein
LQHGQSGRHAIHIGDLVDRFEFASFHSLSNVNGDDLKREARQACRGPSRRFFATPLPQQVEDLALIQNRDEYRTMLLNGSLE